MGAIYGIVGNGTPADMEQMRNRLQHRGFRHREWCPDANVFFGKLTSKEILGSVPDGMSIAADASLYNEEELIQQRLPVGRNVEVGDPSSALMEALFHEYGPDSFRYLNGDFVVAIWDSVSERLLLARDPVGARTLYYYCDDSLIAFAPEYKALLALDDVSIEPDRQAVQILQNSKYLSPERTLLRSIRQVPAGHWLVLKNGRVSATRYWDVRIAPQRISLADAEEQLRNHFFGAVDRRIRDRSSMGFSLSGGIDSAAIVAAARKLHHTERLVTFTIGSGEEDPEIQMARVVAEEFGTDHHELFIEPGQLLDDLFRLIWHLEDPIARTETYLYFALMESASRYADVVVGGYAGDGLFAGMPKHKLVKMAQVLPFMRSSIEEFYQYTQTSKRPTSTMAKLATRVYFGPHELSPPTVTGISPVNNGSSFPSGHRELLDRVLRDGLLHGVPAWMPKVEKPHAAHGVEFRSPFTDPQLIRFTFTLPERFKMRYLEDKYIFRRALLPLLPGEVAKRPKYPQQMDYDMELSEVLDILADRYLNEQAVRERDLFRPEDIARLRQRPTGRPYSKNRAMQLWTAVATEVWARIFLDSRGASPAD